MTEHHLEFLSLKGGCTGSSESTLVKMLHCWKSYVVAHLYLLSFLVLQFAIILMGKRELVALLDCLPDDL